MKSQSNSVAKVQMSVKARPFADTTSRSRHRWLLLFCFAGCLLPRLLLAQSFNLDCFIFASGGGGSSGGQYILNSTFGQPFGGDMSSANFAVSVGFENIVENLEPVTPPLLRIARTNSGTVLVLWPASATGWVLQENSRLDDAAGWTDVTARVVVNGTDNTVTLPLLAGARFYRLRHS